MIDADIDYDKLNMIVCIRETMSKVESTAQKGIIDKLDELIIKELNPIQSAETSDNEISF